MRCFPLGVQMAESSMMGNRSHKVSVVGVEGAGVDRTVDVGECIGVVVVAGVGGVEGKCKVEMRRMAEVVVGVEVMRMRMAVGVLSSWELKELERSFQIDQETHMDLQEVQKGQVPEEVAESTSDSAEEVEKAKDTETTNPDSGQEKAQAGTHFLSNSSSRTHCPNSLDVKKSVVGVEEADDSEVSLQEVEAKTQRSIDVSESPLGTRGFLARLYVRRGTI